MTVLEVIGSTYLKSAKAGDGLTVGDGVGVRFVNGKKSILKYDFPEPPDGSVGVVSGDLYVFGGDTIAKVLVNGGSYDIPVQNLRVADAGSASYTKQVAALATAAHGCHAVGDASAWLCFALVCAIIVALYLLAQFSRKARS